MESKAKPSSIVPDSSGLGAKDWVTVVMESYPFDNTTGARRNNGTPQDPMLLEGHRTSPPLVTGAVADFLVSSGSAGRVATASSLENAPMNENMEPYSIGRETHISPEGEIPFGTDVASLPSHLTSTHLSSMEQMPT
eukprot:CAMPEP_0116866076 /NCGR_PEP_ID=MMETSP0418-20121206/25819_1 /TAXON_ID=1158023 /ORGANISM="Astrosyne radiata, Strain 13vi08-1A" /LENGTH=136 /DNA_ID=CAMNT_0004501653 /DNA_START=1534 /DNA_END=1941 /DNA_ORIENTATION=-